MRRSSPPVPRRRPRQTRAAFTVDAMVTAVERVLETHGVAGLTTNRVAEVAGVSVGTLYHYFPNKEAMVGALQERVLQEVLVAFRAVLGSAAGVPLAVLAERIGSAMLALHHGHRPIYHWLIELRTSAAYQERFRAVLDLFVAELAVFFAARPELRVDDAPTAAFVLIHAIEGVAAAVGARAGKVDASAVVREAVQLVIAYSDRWQRNGA